MQVELKINRDDPRRENPPRAYIRGDGALCVRDNSEAIIVWDSHYGTVTSSKTVEHDEGWDPDICTDLTGRSVTLAFTDDDA